MRQACCLKILQKEDFIRSCVVDPQEMYICKLCNLLDSRLGVKFKFVCLNEVVKEVHRNIPSGMISCSY